MEEEGRLEQLVEQLAEDDNVSGKVYETCGIFFIITTGRGIVEMSSESGASPRGGNSVEVFRGPSDDVKQMMSGIITKLNISEDLIDTLSEYFNPWYAEESCMEGLEDELSREDYDTLMNLKRIIDTGKSPVDSIAEFIELYQKMDLDHNTLYYEWEGEFIDLYDNICECGEESISTGYLSEDEWIDILENLDIYAVSAE